MLNKLTANHVVSEISVKFCLFSIPYENIIELFPYGSTCYLWIFEHR